ncbi:LacI family DNA-binding transcriptional regulator [Streptomyces sp. NPDC007325]|uniref:LacI family DNA-binding transcriptional regulator n=1 Tax=Streptomyces sp. NPDC007325 TaxID=3154588 RepID=UPI0033D6CB86
MPPTQRHATLADVAARAGVSPSTVSRAMRGLPTVSPEVRARVEQAARELNFAVSRQAASLVTGRTGVVAALVPTLDSWFMGSALSSLGPLLRASGREMNVYVLPDLAERASFFERLPARRNADALLVFGFDLTQEETARLDELEMPVIYVSQHTEGRPSVYVDDVAGGCKATRHLLHLGHRRIAFAHVASSHGFHFSSRERLLGYRQALAEAGIPFDDELVITIASDDRRSVLEGVGRLLALREPPTAVFAEHDEPALSLVSTLRKARVAVPERMSVIGFDDHRMAEWADLSTIAQSPADMGRIAGELALELIESDGAERDARDGGEDGGRSRHIVLPTLLIPRGTTAPPPAPEDE